MTNKCGNNTLTPGKLTVLMLISLGLWVGIVFGGCKARDALAASPYQACEAAITFPVVISIDSDVDREPWVAAVDEWNRHYPHSFTVGGGGVRIVPSATTWVELPCGHVAVIHSGHDVSLTYWAAHELVHTLAVRDYVPAGTNLTGYINPGVCPGGYSGIASYCTQRENCWGADDDHMMSSLGYHWTLRVAF